MKFSRFELAGILAALALAVFGGAFVLGQGIAHADADGEEITNEVYTDLCEVGLDIFTQCDDGEEDASDPCDLPGMDSNPDCNGGGNDDVEPDPCDIFDQMDNLPPNCEGGSGDGGGGGGGGSGSEGAACSDTLDNDGDGLVDLSDPGCSNADDTDETDPSTGGGGGSTDPSPSTGGGGSGGGSGGGGGSTGTTTATSTGSILGTASTTDVTCDQYLTAFIKFGGKNDAEQVTRLQHILKNFEGAGIEENGVYDEATLAAVHAFQLKYADTILAPWNIKQSTGYVYLTTRKKVNEIYCKNNIAFPLSTEENELIEKTKEPITSAQPVKAAAQKTQETPAAKPRPTSTTTKATPQESPVSRPWTPITDFFRRLFNRAR